LAGALFDARADLASIVSLLEHAEKAYRSSPKHSS
jgi:hypothetical protein